MNDTRSVSFWESLPASNEISFAWSLPNSRYSQTHTISHDQLKELLQDDLDIADWDSSALSASRSAAAEARADVESLPHYDWQATYAARNLTCIFNDGDAQFAENFEQATERLLPSALARELVKHGYINDYFALYVAKFEDKLLSAAAMNFIVRTLDSGTQDFTYALDEGDVRAILRDRGDGLLAERASFNINILDYLLKVQHPRLADYVQLTARWERTDQDFVNSYVSYGEYVNDFGAILARWLPTSISWAIEDAPVDEATRPALVDAVLSHVDTSEAYDVGSDFIPYVLEYYRHFPSITESALTLRKASTIQILAKEGLRLPDVEMLNDRTRREVVRYGTYYASPLNIMTLAGSASACLDDVRSASLDVYTHTLEHITEYLEEIDHENGVTISDSNVFATILEEVVAIKATITQADMLALVRWSNPDCKIDNLSEAPREAWDALALNNRTSASVANAIAWHDDEGAFSPALAHLLRSRTKFEHVEASGESDRIRLAIDVLNASELAETETRIELARSLHLPSPLDLPSIIPELATCAALLIKYDLLPDSVETFAWLGSDWRSREEAIMQSDAFSSFASPQVLPSEHLADFFTSSISASDKRSILDVLPEYSTGVPRGGAEAAARFAQATGANLTEAQLAFFVNNKASAQLVISLIAQSPNVGVTTMRTLLQKMGNPYTDLANRGLARPVVPDDAPHQIILTRLKAAGIVSSTRLDHKSSKVRVFLHRP